MENENQPKVLIVGEPSEGKTALIGKLASALHLIAKEEFIDLQKQIEQEEVVYTISRPKEVDINFATPYSTKEFVCKGKHQYREVREQKDGVINTKWVCQCGRTL
jgi:MoxR-like ATPase